MSDISVVIPTYNRSEMLALAINSSLNQTIPPREIIVVDDASTDNTEEVATTYGDRINYIQHEVNKGGAAARNTGIKEATGEYIAFLDSDDQWKPQKIEEQVKELQNRPSHFVAVYCGVEHEKNGFSGKIRQILGNTCINHRESGYEGGSELIAALLATKLQLGGTSTLLVKRKTVEELNGFDSSFPRHQDWEFLIRLLQIGNIAYLDKPLVKKTETGSPSLEDTLKAKKIYFRKFNDEIEAIEKRGIDIRGHHYRNLAKIAFREGEYKLGIKFSRQSSVNTIGQVFEISHAVFTGLMAES
ncbi:glycosyl transferase family protein [Natronococcus amylolyticus DSM 10524]|uniref:Glycosyl transferase family protein n=1 Tax=Natronococcus amylolyticus DSM 10524 TaxID=1227497 RepID=L9X2X0_9EURY|nr:glycosyltransferase [Natronococcus amylolyticus]ELY54938.1 glycosyl transferase family protein [Natronococcus amylolyticus DSM 10524]